MKTGVSLPVYISHSRDNSQFCVAPEKVRPEWVVYCRTSGAPPAVGEFDLRRFDHVTLMRRSIGHLLVPAESFSEASNGLRRALSFLFKVIQLLTSSTNYTRDLYLVIGLTSRISNNVPRYMASVYDT